MKINLKRKAKGFTLIELIAVIVILGIVITIGINSISKTISSSKEKLYNEQVDRIINISKTWAIQNTEILPEKNETVYVTLQNLRDEQLLNGTVINPIDNTEMNGCVRVTNNDSKEAYTYDYFESNNCPNLETVYSISYNLNGGTLVKQNPTSYTIRTSTFTLNNPTKTGNYFVGWQLDGTSEVRETVRIYKGSTGNKNYTAIWDSIAYTLTINPNGGIYDGSSEIVSYTKAYGANVEIQEPERQGYRFLGWTVEADDGLLDEEQGIFTMGMSNATLTANWEIICTAIPEYTYTGDDSGIIDDGNGNWRIKFLTSGTFTLTTPVCDSNKIDVFMVGGGSSDGGSGYTQTYKQIPLESGKPYEIVVGEGGAPGSDGTASTAFGYSAEPGSGCDGGSGCGSNGYTEAGAAGGSDGSNGKNSTYDGGTGQGRTTREFGETVGQLYAGGGGGGTGWCWGTCPKTGCSIGDSCYNGGFDGGTGGSGGGGNGASKDASCTDGEANTGGGAGTGIRGAAECSGGSGIVIIRKAIDLGVEYTYTGESELVEDGNGNWRLRLLTDGTLVFNRLTTDIDAFLVGGGGGAQSSSYPSAGGGGGGGYTQTIVVKPEIGKEYEIIIGSGGAAGSNGEATSAFGYNVLGGRTSYGGIGGNGGSGGGGHGYSGGSDGADGYGSETYLGGEGQEYSTREFGEESGTLYAGGGAGYNGTAGAGNGKANTGGGGSAYSGSGYSGIVVIRNTRNTVSDVKYEYTGDSFFVDDGEGNWRIKFLSDGIFKPLEDMTIDVFLVGGGGGAQSSSYPSAGGGGGGGYTSINTINLTINQEYEITIGAGGSAGNSGGTTSFYTFEADGGNAGASGKGGAGGSGGGGHGYDGGSDGSNGSGSSKYTGGTGQIDTTREFGEANGRLYSGGGAGYNGTAGEGNGKVNTGGGGSAYSGSGYSGIAVIRNTR